MSDTTVGRRLRRGDTVEVLGPSEILATLDDNACVNGLPFMPEMAASCGRRFTIDRQAERVCDTIKYTGTRRLADSVWLSDDGRCNGSGHGGCQAECRVAWKEVWLRRIPPGAAPTPQIAQSALQSLIAFTAARVKRNVAVGEGSEERWACQNTELFGATTHVRTYDLRSYLGECTNGNLTLGHCLRVTARAAIEESLHKIRPARGPFVSGSNTVAPPHEALNLQPGDWVQVRDLEEIRATLTPQGTNRGLFFDREMTPYCGGVFRVRQRITRFIDEFRDTGRMVEMKSDAVTLEGAVCSGELSLHRWMCPRKIYPYWRECWLRRVPAPSGGG